MWSRVFLWSAQFRTIELAHFYDISLVDLLLIDNGFVFPAILETCGVWLVSALQL